MKLEELRTKEEIIKYFKQLGKNITEEEIDALKQSYEQTEENSGTLTLQQLNDVAGGAGTLIFCPERLANEVREDIGIHNLSVITLPNKTSYFGGLAIFFESSHLGQHGELRIKFCTDDRYIFIDPSVLKKYHPLAYGAFEQLTKHVDEIQFELVSNYYSRKYGNTDPDPLAKTNLIKALKSSSEIRDHSFEETSSTAIEDFRQFMWLESRRRSSLPEGTSPKPGHHYTKMNPDALEVSVIDSVTTKWFTGEVIVKTKHAPVPNINEDGIGSSTAAYDIALNSYGEL